MLTKNIYQTEGTEIMQTNEHVQNRGN